MVPEILRDGVDRLVAVVMAPHYSRMSVGAYLARLDEALREQQATVPVHAVESWKDEPDFIAAWVDRIAAALRTVPETERSRTLLLFTAHSLPTRILDWGDPYREEILTSVRLVAAHFPEYEWRFAFQSQGASEEPWLGPTVEETLDELAAAGVARVLLVPIGFVCDHVEVLYDVDIAHKEYALSRGIVLARPAMLNDHPLLCRAIANAVRRTLRERVLGYDERSTRSCGRHRWGNRWSRCGLAPRTAESGDRRHADRGRAPPRGMDPDRALG